MVDHATTRILSGVSIALVLLLGTVGCARVTFVQLKHYHRRALPTWKPALCGVDPTCYGYHPTCWRSWPGECPPSMAYPATPQGIPMEMIRDPMAIPDAPAPGPTPFLDEPFPPAPMGPGETDKEDGPGHASPPPDAAPTPARVLEGRRETSSLAQPASYSVPMSAAFEPEERPPISTDESTAQFGRAVGACNEEAADFDVYPPDRAAPQPDREAEPPGYGQSEPVESEQSEPVESRPPDALESRQSGPTGLIPLLIPPIRELFGRRSASDPTARGTVPRAPDRAALEEEETVAQAPPPTDPSADKEDEEYVWISSDSGPASARRPRTPAENNLGAVTGRP